MTPEIATTLAPGLKHGDSVAVNGACLTAVEIDAAGFAVDCVAETLRRTTLGGAGVGDRVNLEIDVLARYLQRMQSLRG